MALAIVFTLACVPLSQTTTSSVPVQNKKLVFADYKYEANIKSDQLYPNRGFTQDVVQNAIIGLNSNTRLILEFDELYADYIDYNARIIHCNADWTKSTLPDLEFTTGFNEYPVRDYEYSQNTLVPYTHYRFEVPEVNVPGNYLLVLYRDTNRDDIIISRRFVVFDSKIRISPSLNVMTGSVGRFEKHQIEFDINYGGLQVMNPFNDIKVVIRQNGRWDNAIFGLKPTQIKPDRSLLQYRHFTGENTFYASNEFRFADLRSISFKGQKIREIEKTQQGIDAYLEPDLPRGGQIFSQYSDLNGWFVIENNDPGADYLEEDYITTHFELRFGEITNPIYLLGAFNNWNRQHVMTFDPVKKAYTTSLDLKQGFYNYLYLVDEGDPHPYFLEGSFFDAENDYDILVYFRDPSTFSDKAFGYTSFNSRK